MKRPSRSIYLLLTLTIVLLCTQSVGAATKHATIRVANEADNDGVIVFAFRPEGSLAVEITVQVRQGWDRKRIAEEIFREFWYAIGADYEISKSRNSVHIHKEKRRTPRFDLRKTGQTVQRLSVIVRY